MENDFDYAFRLRLTKEEEAKVKAAASKDDRSINSYIRQLINK